MKASLSIDLDNKWSYMKTHGDAGWVDLPSYMPVLIPKVLDIADELKVRMTCFIVGQDAEMPAHDDLFGELARRGHEIGNHSHYHEPWMHRRDAAAIDDEFARSEEAIERATGQRPHGFRGPGFVRSDTILETLVRRGYSYDASSLPTFIGPLARAYYFRTAKLPPEELAERGDLFGRFSDALNPNDMHDIPLRNGSLVEIPVTTMPIFRVPIHISYVLYIATVSPAAAVAYFKLALRLCKLTNTHPSILLHPLDFLTEKDAPELGFFPAMRLDGGVKRHVVSESLRALAKAFVTGPLREALPGPAIAGASPAPNAPPV